MADLASKQLKMLVAMHFNTLIEGSVSDMYRDIHHAAEQTILSLPSSITTDSGIRKNNCIEGIIVNVYYFEN